MRVFGVVGEVVGEEVVEVVAAEKAAGMDGAPQTGHCM
jgi:hypothetical protein